MKSMGLLTLAAIVSLKKRDVMRPWANAWIVDVECSIGIDSSDDDDVCGTIPIARNPERAMLSEKFRNASPRVRLDNLRDRCQP